MRWISLRSLPPPLEKGISVWIVVSFFLVTEENEQKCHKVLNCQSSTSVSLMPTGKKWWNTSLFGPFWSNFFVLPNACIDVLACSKNLGFLEICSWVQASFLLFLSTFPEGPVRKKTSIAIRSTGHSSTFIGGGPSGPSRPSLLAQTFSETFASTL